MTRTLIVALLLLLPGTVGATTVEATRSLVVSEALQGNTYLLGADVTLTAPAPADLTVAAGTVVLAAPVSGDASVAGGTVVVRRPVLGDLRVLGGQIKVEDVIAGDLFAVGGSVTVGTSTGYAWVAGGLVSFTGGSEGDVVIYGTTATLAGEFKGDVSVTVSDAVTIADGTVIHGALRYNAPQEAVIPATARITGVVEYTGSSYLPTNEEAQNFAVFAAGLFFFIRILAVLIAVGILAGLFPRFAQAVADEVLTHTMIRFLLLTLLGFALMVATPALILILLATFAGAAVAFLVLAAYVFLLLVAYFFSAVIAGAILARGLLRRQQMLWRDAVIGMLALSVIGLIPVAGTVVFVILYATSIGAIAILFYRFAFGNSHEDDWSL